MWALGRGYRSFQLTSGRGCGHPHERADETHMWVLHYFRTVFIFVLFFGRGFNDSKFIPDINDLGTKESAYVISQSTIITIVRKTEIIHRREECFHSSKQLPKITTIVIYKVRTKSFRALCIIRVTWFLFSLKVRKYDVSLVLHQVFSALRLCLFTNAISTLYQGTCGLVVTLLVQIGACCSVVFNQLFRLSGLRLSPQYTGQIAKISRVNRFRLSIRDHFYFRDRPVKKVLLTITNHPQPEIIWYYWINQRCAWAVKQIMPGATKCPKQPLTQWAWARRAWATL